MKRKVRNHGYNQFQKLRDNIAAIKIALEYQEGNLLSDADAAILQTYSGFGDKGRGLAGETPKGFGRTE